MTSRSGEPLPAAVRENLEYALNADLGAVRVHVGARADALTRRAGADAVAGGADIYVRAGAYRPHTGEGLRLLAHEAAHLVQQAGGQVRAGALAQPLERAADRLAAAVVAGTAKPPDRRVRVLDRPTGVLQAHAAYEHRVLGDLLPEQLTAIVTHAGNRDEVLQRQLQLLSLWRRKPATVTENQVNRLCDWIRTVRLGPDRVLATYGELNALPDFLPDGESLETLGAGTLLPLLQMIRQEGFNKLTELYDNTDPLVRFPDSPSAPHGWSMVNSIIETQALDRLTSGLGPQGSDHYLGLLARNACHFAPFSWYRWQVNHLLARNAAYQAFRSNREPGLVRRAWTLNGYADHFLQDSFAAGHLLNKTLVMQWFVEWAAEHTTLLSPFLVDIDAITAMTPTLQPHLAGRDLYDPSYAGGSPDPQTAQEAATLVGRVLASAVGPGPGTDQFTAYQQYLTFITSVATQLSAARVHDHFNEQSLWVSSPGHPDPYEVWGDLTLLTGAQGREGVDETSKASRMAQQAIADILYHGESRNTPESIRRRIPTEAGTDPDTMAPLQAFTDTQKSFITDAFDAFVPALKTLLTRASSPRLNVVSQDQEFATIWASGLDGAANQPVDITLHDGRLYAAAEGRLFELDRTSGRVLRSAVVVRDAEGRPDTRIAVAGSHIVVACQGYLFGYPVNDWRVRPWQTSVGGSLFAGRTRILVTATSLYCGANGWVYHLDPANGNIRNKLELLHSSGAGNYETRLALSDRMLFAGTHGVAYGIRLSDWSRPAWHVGVGGMIKNDPVTMLHTAEGTFAGSDGYVYRLDPDSGHILDELLLGGRVGVGNYDVWMTSAPGWLYCGTHGWANGVSLKAGFTKVWSTDVGGNLPQPVHIARCGNQLITGSDGYVVTLDPSDGSVLQELLLTYLVPTGGDYTVSLAVDDLDVYAGVHGYVDRLLTQRRTLNGNLYHTDQNAAGDWSGWVRSFKRAPNAVQQIVGAVGPHEGRLEVFAIGGNSPAGGNNELYQISQDDKDRWSTWQPDFDQAPAQVKSVALARNPNGHLEVFAVGAVDGRIHHNWQDGDGKWHHWSPSFDGLHEPVQLTMPVRGPAGLEVFAIGQDGTLYRDHYHDGRWRGWEAGFNRAPGPVQQLCASPDPSGHLSVFTIGLDGTLLHATQRANGDWQPWTAAIGQIPARMRHAFAVRGAGEHGDLELFAIGQLDGALYHNRMTADGRWQGWAAKFNGMSAPIQSITGAVGTAKSLQVFATGLDGTLYQCWQDGYGTWHRWTAGFGGAGPMQEVAAMRGAAGRLEVFAYSAINPDGGARRSMRRARAHALPAVPR
jgi:hypothetical protein